MFFPESENTTAASPIGRVSFYRGMQSYAVSAQGLCKVLKHLGTSNVHDHVDGILSSMIPRRLLNVYALKDSLIHSKMLVKHVRNRKSTIFL
jgi:hypothetical protein